jgi:hypothetical protein
MDKVWLIVIINPALVVSLSCGELLLPVKIDEGVFHQLKGPYVGIGHDFLRATGGRILGVRSWMERVECPPLWDSLAASAHGSVDDDGWGVCVWFGHDRSFNDAISDDMSLSRNMILFDGTRYAVALEIGHATEDEMEQLRKLVTPQG